MIVYFTGDRHPFGARIEYIPFTRFYLKIEFITPFEPPGFLGTTLRGGFGTAFRRSVCVTKYKTCKECILRESCVYSYIFETPSRDKSIANAPHPFIFNPPLEIKEHYDRGDTLKFELILIGKGIEYLPYFIYAFEVFGEIGMGKDRSKFYVKRVYRGKKIIYDGKNLYRGWDKPTRLRRLNISGDKLKITFYTPTKIISGGNIIRVPEFVDIIRALQRRIILLNRYHNQKIIKEKKDLIEEAKNGKIIKNDIIGHPITRYSSRQGRKIEMYGFTGSIVYKGDFKPFTELLRLGEVVHIGKATSFGFGRYRIEEYKEE